MERHKRGTRIVRGGSLLRCLGPLCGAWPWARCLRVAGVAILAAEETKHFKLIGTTGSGKSTAIAQLLHGALQRGDRAVIADPDGGYLTRFHDRSRGDVILNPFEQRSMKWDPFSEIQDPYDIEQLATGLIASGGDASGQEWRGYARTFLTAVARRCYLNGRHDIAELWRLLAVATNHELRTIVAGTPAQPFLEQDNARMFGSIRSITGSTAAALAHVQLQRGTSFSVRDWVRNGTGVLFMPYKANQIPALRALIAAWMRLAIFEAMSCVEHDQHLWFVMDELDALGAIDGLKDALARMRKFGGRCVLGFQSVAQVSSTYGAGDAQTLVENCGNTLILRCSGSDAGGTAHFASRLIGDREIIRRQTSRSRDQEALLANRAPRRSLNTSEQHVTEPAVLASEIEQLADLSGYLKTASSRAWRRVQITR
ncbi:MAG TPA: type IV secretion system DNA-binding domain-containing protein [Steroidobacteraceae bacterium]